MFLFGQVFSSLTYRSLDLIRSHSIYAVARLDPTTYSDSNNKFLHNPQRSNCNTDSDINGIDIKPCKRQVDNLTFCSKEFVAPCRIWIHYSCNGRYSGKTITDSNWISDSKQQLIIEQNNFIYDYFSTSQIAKLSWSSSDCWNIFLDVWI